MPATSMNVADALLIWTSRSDSHAQMRVPAGVSMKAPQSFPLAAEDHPDER